MKTSNKIFISFLIFLFGGIILLFIGSKYYKGIDYKADFAIQEKKTAPFSVVVAEPGAFLVLKNGKEFSVSQGYKKDAISNLSSFVVRNDTLYMSAVKLKIGDKWFTFPEVYCNNVKHIIAKERTNVNIKNYQVDSLFVNLDKSDFFWDFNKPAFVFIESKNSYVHLNGDYIEKMKLQLDKTQFYINSKKGTKELSGSLINDSEFQGNIEGKVSIEVDKSSRIYIR
jgi:hypothetical protein